MRLNSVQKDIVQAAGLIDEQSGGLVKITVRQQGSVTWFDVWENGVVTMCLQTNQATAFVRAWKLSKATHEPFTIYRGEKLFVS